MIIPLHYSDTCVYRCIQYNFCYSNIHWNILKVHKQINNWKLKSTSLQSFTQFIALVRILEGRSSPLLSWFRYPMRILSFSFIHSFIVFNLLLYCLPSTLAGKRLWQISDRGTRLQRSAGGVQGGVVVGLQRVSSSTDQCCHTQLLLDDKICKSVHHLCSATVFPQN